MATIHSSDKPSQLEQGDRENNMSPIPTAHDVAGSPEQIATTAPVAGDGETKIAEPGKTPTSPIQDASLAAHHEGETEPEASVESTIDTKAESIADEHAKQPDSTMAKSNTSSSKRNSFDTEASLQIKPLQLGKKSVDSKSVQSNTSDEVAEQTIDSSKQGDSVQDETSLPPATEEDAEPNQSATVLKTGEGGPDTIAMTDSNIVDAMEPGDAIQTQPVKSDDTEEFGVAYISTEADSEQKEGLDAETAKNDDAANDDIADDESIIYEPKFIISPEGKKVRIPVHPISSFQMAFEESIQESTFNPDARPYIRQLDGKSRRELLLSQPRDDKPFDSTWRYRPGLQYHELYKMIAQIAFGVGLMFFGVANDTSTVVNILQQHIDDMDEFLEVSVEDQCMAIDDLMKRSNYLKLLMGNMPAFEEFLEEEEFCKQILEGNEKLVLVLDRNAAAVRQWDDDIETGLKACGAFAKWLYENEEGDWRNGRADIADVFDAMKGNTQGWIKAFEDMNLRSGEANNLVLGIMSMVGEIDLKAENVQRKRQGLNARSEVRDSVASFTTRHRRGPTGRDGNGVEKLQAKKEMTKETDAAVAKHIDLHYGVPEPRPPFVPPKKGEKDETDENDETDESVENVEDVERVEAAEIDTLASVVQTESAPSVAERFDEEDDEDDGEMYPLPGGLPLLPPSRYPNRHGAASISSKSSQPDPDSAKLLSPERVSIRSNRNSFRDSSLSPMYLLQPKTYSPADAPTYSKKSNSDAGSTHKSGAASIASQSRSINDRDSESSPSVVADKQSRRKSHISSVVSQTRSIYGHESDDGEDVVDIADMYAFDDKYPVEDAQSMRSMSKKSSLRSRISKPPEAISIPPRSPVQTATLVPSPGYAATPATTTSMNNDSAYGSDIDAKFRQQRPRGYSSAELSPPNIASLVPSPHSENQYYRPVKASPHSPLQQRPQTSAAENYHMRNEPTHQHVRNKPSIKSSKILGVSVETIAAANTNFNNRNGLTPTPESLEPFSVERQATEPVNMNGMTGNSHRADLIPSPVSAGPTLKKKKSTFGWFKKAFTMDEDERAQFDQRRAAYQHEQERIVREQNAPRFLDGKRIR